MPEPVFPSLPGQGWSVFKKPIFATRKQSGTSGRELRLADQVYPIWEFTLTFNFLRDKWDIRAGVGIGFGGAGSYDELRTLMGFFLARQGSYQPFLFDDPTDNSLTGQLLGAGDGSNAAFQLYRTMGAFVEPITAPHTVSAVYVDGVDPGGWSVDDATGIVTMASPPAAAGVVTADFSYYFRCRFSDDEAEFENFMYQLWSVKTLKFRSILL